MLNNNLFKNIFLIFILFSATAFAVRFPIPGGDEDTWGSILEGVWNVSHTLNGTLLQGINTSFYNINSTGDLRVSTINGTDFALFNKSIDLGNYLTSSSFSNFQLSNVSNNTLVKGDNSTLALWNISSTSIFQRDLSKNIGIGTINPYNNLVVIGSVSFSGTLNSTSINTTQSAYFAVNSGLVGIGTITPTESLSVVGNFSVTKTNNTMGNLTFMQFNSSCAGFRFGSNGGGIFSCN